jgi:lysophospholipase L1-like esterase
MNAEANVRALLPRGTALLCPAVNCESSREVAARIDEWAPAAEGDLVHINCGLHDIRHDPGVSWPVCTLEQYQHNLSSVFEFLSARRARVIWATSTPFLEQVHNSAKASRRFLGHLLEYNAASRDLVEAYGFAVNDMYVKLAGASLGELLLPDGVHFNSSGNALVAELIVAAINSVLAPNNSSKPTPLRGAA